AELVLADTIALELRSLEQRVQRLGPVARQVGGRLPPPQHGPAWGRRQLAARVEQLERAIRLLPQLEHAAGAVRHPGVGEVDRLARVATGAGAVRVAEVAVVRRVV